MRSSFVSTAGLEMLPIFADDHREQVVGLVYSQAGGWVLVGLLPVQTGEASVVWGSVCACDGLLDWRGGLASVRTWA